MMGQVEGKNYVLCSGHQVTEVINNCGSLHQATLSQINNGSRSAPFTRPPSNEAVDLQNNMV
ncbi:hypothetical protein HJC23_001797 [Cyclotella cryptica]|uniref:Uncharacterized protein n=1 Tax=Cyclotella cryptica TaxID=29204 RepID=A0ABD3QPN5_9STRA